jgi:mannose-6-phosphate isomerase-like protein (cupin superfamily)
MDFTVGNDFKKVYTADIIEIPKGFPYNFSSTKEDPVRFAAVRSNDHLEYLIDNQ